MLIKSKQDKKEEEQQLAEVAAKGALWRDVLSRFLRTKTGVVGFFIIVVLLFLIIFAPFLTKYKYDKNDSIVKETCRKTSWYEMPVYRDEVWQSTDSTGRLIDYSDYVVEYNKYKTKSKSVRIISRDEKGVPVEEIYETKSNNKKDSEPRIVKTRYDEMGRVVEETRINCPYSGCFRKVFKYYNDSERLTYYATYNGDDEESVSFSHESLLFYDERDNCIAHIQWMPGNSSEYYFDVYRYEYYE